MKSSPAVLAAKAAETVLAIALSLSAFVFVLGLPWQDLGVWPEQELTAAGLHAISALMAVALGSLVALGDRRALGAVTSPPVLALALFAAVTLALSPYGNSPWTSVYGTLQHEVGGLWHLEVAVLAAGAVVVLASRMRWLVLASLLLSSVAAVAIDAFPGLFGLGKAFLFPEWTGLLCGAAAFAVMVRSPRILSPWSLAAFATLVVGLIVSGNRAVALAAVAVAFFGVIGSLPVARKFLAPRSARAFVTVWISLAGLVATWAAGPAIESYRLRQLPLAATEVASEMTRDQINMMSGGATVWSRSYMVRVVLEDLAQHPSALLHGNGWGSFSEVYERHAREVPGRMFPAPVPSASHTYWDSHSKANFHSHNIPAEALNAAGLPGLVLWLGFLAILAASSRSGFLVSAGIATVSTFWFPVTHMTTAVAVLIAAGSAMGRPSAKARAALSAIAPLPAVFAFSSLAMASFLVLNLARLETAERHFEGVAVDRNPGTCGAITARFLPERESAMYLYRVLVNKVMASPDPYKTLFDHASNVALYSCTMRSYSAHGADIRVLAESLQARARLASIGPGALGIIADDVMNWGDDIDAMLAVAPERTEFIPPYILNLRERNKGRMASEAERLAAVLQVDDPVRYWLLSVLADAKGDVPGSKVLMRRALSLGYANLVPISKEFINSVVSE